jgi:hypothetical protein
VKDPETQDPRAQIIGVSQVGAAGSGRIAFRDDLKPLQTGEEYLACVYLTWKNAKGRVIGTSRTQMITLIGEYVFDRVEDGAVVPLNDVARFRPFWHKAWQGSFSKELYKGLRGQVHYIPSPLAGERAVETTACPKGRLPRRRGA